MTDFLAKQAQRRKYNRTHLANKAAKDQAEAERIRKAHDARLEREAAENERIAAMLRASVSDLRPSRRTP